MKLWIDDVRPSPPGWTLATTVDIAKHIFANNREEIEVISLDHDAGMYVSFGGDYIKFLNWLEYCAEMREWDLSNIKFHIHSMNPVGRRDMERIIEHNNWILTKEI